MNYLSNLIRVFNSKPVEWIAGGKPVRTSLIYGLEMRSKMLEEFCDTCVGRAHDVHRIVSFWEENKTLGAWVSAPPPLTSLPDVILDASVNGLPFDHCCASALGFDTWHMILMSASFQIVPKHSATIGLDPKRAYGLYL